LIEKKHYWQGLKECFCDLQSQSIGSNERMTMQNLQFLKQLKVELFLNGSSHPASQIKTDLRPAAQLLCWLLLSMQKHKNSTASHQQNH
jgi:hypothetical protein